MTWLDGQVALVTGGGSGIGQAIVRRFVEEGARVAVMDRVLARAEKLQAELGKSAIAIGGDVARLEDAGVADEDVQAAERADRLGDRALVVVDKYVLLAEFPEEQLSAAYDELFGVNVKGCILGAKAALPELQKTQGCMVFTASVAGMNSGGGGTLYTASKHAVIGLIRQLASEIGPDVRVNGVAPGGTRTDLRGLATLHQDDRSHFAETGWEDRMRRNNALQMVLEPPDLAGAYVFLASRTNAKGITGTILTVDAGSMLRIRRPS